MSCGNQGCDCGAVGIALLLRTCWARPGLQHPNRLGGKFGQIKRHISPFNPTLWLSFTHKKAWSKPVSVDEIIWLVKSPLCWLKCHALFCWGTPSFMIHSFLHQTDRFRYWMETMINKNRNQSSPEWKPWLNKNNILDWHPMNLRLPSHGVLFALLLPAASNAVDSEAAVVPAGQGNGRGMAGGSKRTYWTYQRKWWLHQQKWEFIQE